VGVLLLMGVTCILTILSIMLMRIALAGTEGSSIIGSIVNAVAIETFNAIWKKVARGLTSWENHRLDRQFRNSLIYKMFIFQFINCYFSFFYLGFIKRHVGDLFGEENSCGDGLDCMDELQMQLAVLLLVNLCAGHFIELSRPLRKGLTKKLVGFLSQVKQRGGKIDVEEEAIKGEAEIKAIRDKLEEEMDGGKTLAVALGTLSVNERAVYDEYQLVEHAVDEFSRPLLKSVEMGIDATFYEINELVIQFGYIVMFSVALPAGACIALLSNLIELRADLWKISKVTRRVPGFEPTNGIGAWRTVLNALTFIGLMTNLLLLATTSTFFDDLGIHDNLTRFGIIVGCEHVLLLLKLAIDAVVPDVPAAVQREMAREEWLTEAAMELKKNIAEAETERAEEMESEAAAAASLRSPRPR